MEGVLSIPLADYLFADPRQVPLGRSVALDALTVGVGAAQALVLLPVRLFQSKTRGAGWAGAGLPFLPQPLPSAASECGGSSWALP